MNVNGLLHFDAHFGNILTDGRRLYLADLGLAAATRFDLAPDERDFITQNLSHDAWHTMTELVNWLVTHVAAVAESATGGPVERNAYIRRCAAGARPPGRGRRWLGCALRSAGTLLIGHCAAVADRTSRGVIDRTLDIGVR